MADDIGGIRSEVTADTSPLFAALQQAAAEMRRWDEQYGKLTVRISAQLPTQQQVAQTHGQINELFAKQGALQIPIQLVAPSQDDVRRTHQVTVQGITAAQAAQQNATPAQQITRPPVQQAAVAAQSGKSDSMLLAEAQAIANSTGQPRQYQTASGAIARAYPNVSRGGPVGGAGGALSVGGEPLPPVGPQGLFGGIGIAGANQLQNDVAQLRRENEQLRAVVRGIGPGGGAEDIPGRGPVGIPAIAGGGAPIGSGRIGLGGPRNEDPYARSQRQGMRDLRREAGTYVPPASMGGRPAAQVAAGLSGLAKEVYDSSIARGQTPETAMQAVYDVLADEPPSETLKQLSGRQRSFSGRMSNAERAEDERLAAEEAIKVAGADRALLGGYGFAARGAAANAPATRASSFTPEQSALMQEAASGTGRFAPAATGGAGGGAPDWVRQSQAQMVQHAERTGVADQIRQLAAQRQLTARQIASQVGVTGTDEYSPDAIVRAVREAAGIEALGGAGNLAAGGAGGGGGGRRRPPAAAPPPPPEEPARPERRASSRVFPGAMSDEDLRAALREGGRGPQIIPTGQPGRGELETGGIIPARNRGGTPYRSGVDLSLISEAQYLRERNLIRGRTAQIARPGIESAPVAAENQDVQALYAPEGGRYAGLSRAETEAAQQRELLLTQGLTGTPAEQAAATARMEADQPPTRDEIRRRGRGGGAGTRVPPIEPERRSQILAEDPRQVRLTELIRSSQELGVQAQAGVQQRALGTYIAGTIAAGAGRPAAVVDIREQQRATAALNASREKELPIQAQVLDAETKLSIAKRAATGDTEGLTAAQIKEAGSVEEASKQYQFYRSNLEEAEKRTDQLAAKTITAGKALGEGASEIRGLTAGFVGGIAGSLAYGVGITAVTGAISLFEKAAGRGVDVITGYIGISQKTTDALSDQARAQHGLTSVAVAQTFAQTGLSEGVANTIRPLIEQRTALEAGSKAFGEQVDLLRTYQQLQQQGTRGGIPGITTGTGGVLGSQLFAQPGIAQQLAFLTQGGQARETGGALGAVGGALAGAGIGAISGAGVFSVPGAIIGGIAGGVGGFFGGRAVGGALGGLPDLAAGAGGAPTQAGPSLRTGRAAAFGPPSATFVPPATTAAGLQPNNVIAYTLAVQDLNEAAARGTPNVANLGQAVSQSLDKEDIAQTAEVLKGLGLGQEQVDDLKNAGFAIKGIGDITNFSDALKKGQSFFESAGKGLAIPEPQEVLQRLREQIIPARIFQANAQTALGNRLIDVQAGIATAAAPPLPVGATIPGGRGALSPQASALFEGSQQLQALQVGRIEAARVEISQLTAPLGQGFQQQALGSFDRLQGLGQQAQGLQSFITQSQLGLQTAQFDEQIRQANLQVNDLAATLNVISGTQNKITGSSYDNLGALQGQLIVMQRQSAQLQQNNAELGIQSEELNQQLATLQLQQQQRQINFRVALAGFTAPGVTSEERAANIEQAEKEAQIAQRQLNLRRQILANQREVLQNQRQQVGLQGEALPLQFRIQDITLQRDYVTARHALDLLTRGRQVTIDVAGAQEALGRVNQEIGREQNRLNNYVQRASEFQGQLINDQAEFIQTYSHSTRTLLSTAQEFLGGISTGYADAINDYLIRVTAQVQNSINVLSGGVGTGGGTNPATRTGGGSGPGGAPDPTAFDRRQNGQQGFAGYVGRRTQFTVGEVAGEEVAILRNPRSMNLGGGSNQIVFNISINSPTVRSNDDMETMARTVANAVEERLNRRTSLLGFRP